jgi:hypothetical protein
MTAAEVVLEAAVETMNSLNQSCSATAQALVDVIQEEGTTAVCKRLTRPEPGARISNLTIAQAATSTADCIMVAGTTQQKHLMSETMRERFSAGIARFVAANSENADAITAVNQIKDALSTESFSRCYSRAQAEIVLTQRNACTNIIEDVSITQQSSAVTERCLLEDLVSSNSNLALQMLRGESVGGDDGDGDGEGKSCYFAKEELSIVIVSVLAFALILLLGFVVYNHYSGTDETPDPAKVSGTDETPDPASSAPESTESNA